MTEQVAGTKIVISIPVDQAKAALRDLKAAGSDTAKAFEGVLGSAVDNTSKKIKKLADEISGGGATKKLQDLDKALEHLGGAAQLSSTQLANFAAKVNALTAQGGAASARLQALADSFTKTNAAAATATTGVGSLGTALSSQLSSGAASAAGNLGPLGGILTSLGPAGLAAAAGIAAVVGTAGALGSAAQQAVEFGSRVSDLALKTGITAEGLQRLDFAGSLVGVSMEQASSGVFKFSNALETAPEKVEALGLNVAELKAMAPDQAFAVFAEAVAGIESPSERAAAAMSVLGKSAGELMPLLRALGDEAANAADAFGVVQTDATVAALDDVDDAAAILSKTWDGLIRNIGASVAIESGAADALMGMANAVGIVSTAVSSLVGTFHELRSAITGATSNPLLKSLLSGEATGLGGLTSSLAFFGDAAASRRFNNYDTRATAGQMAFFNENNGGAAAEDYTGDIDGLDEYIAKNKELSAELARGRVERKLAAEEEKKHAAELKKTTQETERAAEAERKRYTAAQDAYRKATEGTATGPFSDELGITSDQAARMTADNARAYLAERNAATGGPKMVMPGMVIPAGVVPTIKSAKDATKDWAQELANVAHMASFLPPVFGQVLTAVAGAGTAIQSLQKWMEGGLTGGKSLLSGGGMAALLPNVSAGIQLAGIGIEIGKSIASVITGGSESSKIAKDVGRDFGVKISEELAKTIEGEGRGRYDGALLHLREIIDEGGGVGKFGGDKAADKVHDLFSAVERGTISLQEAGEAFDSVFGDVAAANISSTTGIANAKLTELVSLAQRFGIESKALREFMLGQATSLGSNLGAGLASTKTTREKTGQGLASQGAATGISSAIAGDFAQLVGAGMSANEAIKSLLPTIASMREELNAAGYEGSAAFLALEERARIVTGEITGPLVAGIGSYTGALVNMHNLNMLTQEDFSGITSQIGANILALEEQGVVGPAAIQALQPDLQRIWELQQRYGFEVDASTQKLLDQAVQAGAVGDQHRSAADKMLEASERTASAVEYLAEQFGYLADKVKSVPSEKTINVRTNYSTSGQPPEESTGPGGEPESFAGTSMGFRDFGRGTAAILHGMEGVFNPAQIDAIKSASYQAGSMSGGASSSRVAASGGNADVVAKLDEMMRQNARILDLLPKAIRDEMAGKAA